jgi:molybdopterin-guanine dinucleotide biosynthesis protein A
VLVAGGRGTRLGGLPKGLLRLEGQPIVARSLRLFGDLFAETLVVANDPGPYAALGARVVGDVFTGKGAPGGLHAALAAARTRWIFAAAVDMPFLAAAPIRWLADRRAGAPAVAVLWHGRLEPLHAFWSQDVLPVAERLLQAGDPSMWQLASAAGARFVDEAAFGEVDPEGRSFTTANTPDDLARLGLARP